MKNPETTAPLVTLVVIVLFQLGLKVTFGLTSAVMIDLAGAALTGLCFWFFSVEEQKAQNV